MNFKAQRLVLEFQSREDLLNWFDDAQKLGAVNDKAEVYRTDVLDHVGNPHHTFIVRRQGSRPQPYVLRGRMRGHLAPGAAEKRKGRYSNTQVEA